MLSNFDIIFITETHFTKGQKFDLNDFVSRHNAYSTVDDVKPRGGISCFLKPVLLKYINNIQLDIPGHVVIDFKNGNTIFGSYIAPYDSAYYDITDFSCVANMFYPVDHNRIIIGGGDMNGRVGDVNYRLPKSMTYSPNVDKVVNSHGNEIISICKSFKCFIVNNLVYNTKTFMGDFTFNKANRKSQNDILLANIAGLDSLSAFEVHDIIWNPSDHAPISACIEMRFVNDSCSVHASKDILSEPIGNEFVKPRSIKSSHVDWGKYKLLIERDSTSYRRDIEALGTEKTLSNLDSLISSMSNSCYTASKVNTIRTEPTAESGSNQNELKGIISNIYERFQGLNNGQQWQNLREEAISHLRQDVNHQTYSSWNNVLESSDPKALWNRISWNGQLCSSDDSEKPSLEDLSRHFAQKGQEGQDSTVLNEVYGSSYVPCLDDEISADEIKSAQKQLKDDKASGDGWTKKMVTNMPLALLLILQMIYNCILKFHVFPSSWRTTVVSEIFKNKGKPTESKNYRPVSLVQLLAKLFDFILLNRFKKWFKPADGQTAYQSKLGCADHVFLLRCMTQYAKKYKTTLFLIAIDFDGAFDRVSRSLLVRKLCKFGAGSIFTACIASIYMSTDNIIFRDSEFVTYKLFSGIKQGLPLSPLLFLFYINDIFDFFSSVYEYCRNEFECLHLLIHADDLTMIAHSREEAIRKLKSLLQYCKSNKIIPQYTKCEFVAVNGTEADREPLPFGEAFLQHASHIVLLGSHLTNTGSVAEDLQLHMKKRHPSVIKFYNFIRSNKSAPLKVKLKVMKACVMGSLLHNSETFGDWMPKDLESTYIKLLKCCLDVRSSTPNHLVLIESGFLPVKALILCRQYKFYKRFVDCIQLNSLRHRTFRHILQYQTRYIKHYDSISTD